MSAAAVLQLLVQCTVSLCLCGITLFPCDAYCYGDWGGARDYGVRQHSQYTVNSRGKQNIKRVNRGKEPGEKAESQSMSLCLWLYITRSLLMLQRPLQWGAVRLVGPVCLLSLISTRA